MFCGLFYIVSLPIAPIFTRIFYPSIYSDAKPLLALANGAALILASGTLAQTIVLRFCKSSSLLYVQIIYSFIYLGGGLLLIKKSGIIGFCWVAILAGLVRLLSLAVFGYKAIKIQSTAV